MTELALYSVKAKKSFLCYLLHEIECVVSKKIETKNALFCKLK